MGKKDKSKKKGKGTEKTAAKTEKKLSQKQKKELAAIGEVWFKLYNILNMLIYWKSNLTFKNRASYI